MLLLHLTTANLKMLARDRQALFWALAFPLIFVIVFGLFFRETQSTQTLAVIDYAQNSMSTPLVESLQQSDHLKVVLMNDEAQARQELRQGDFGHLLIIPSGLASAVTENPPAQITLLYDAADPLSDIVPLIVGRFVDGANLRMAQAPTRIELVPEGISSRNVSYLDFLIPGLAIWGVMNFSVIGIATSMAAYREKRILVRLLATPLRVRVFFAARVLSALALSVLQAAVILAAGWILFGVAVEGNLLHIALLVVLGNIVFLNLGFVVGAFSKTVAAASGLGNAVGLPLMFMSGVFFPIETLPTILRIIVEYLPLAPILEIVRGIALYSNAFWEFPLQLAIVCGWIALSAVAAIRTFRFR
jgi:ABC-2 type transport system permease protein